VLRLVHLVAAAVAILTIATFWLSTLLSELFAPPEVVAMVKGAIPWGFLVLIPALLATGASGAGLAHGRRLGLIGVKTRRMQLIAANGLLILLPAALFLAFRARTADFDATFYTVQAIELAAGLVNITLIALNLRDGLRMTGRLRRRAA
jgi:hypothetical protein